MPNFEITLPFTAYNTFRNPMVFKTYIHILLKGVIHKNQQERLVIVIGKDILFSMDFSILKCVTKSWRSERVRCNSRKPR